ncbi:tRNA (guanosine(46)-N7)-methyltransferase TrmB [Caminibacter pacificus]|uniref:tRNA (guanine-N(7)-)-methyltransferase n=1 Tax=Caminibacter pacificus TaxID=1424653 RepID=A0AAJ4RCI4_9BACT|nr:tRNA (guanosine(46)-N7)-methyltransferase TrmB [Caminibacter pacificus]NPA87781.1 tRNA (guanosine(46)-N7)-methyltransferase TrmB [Campylobacterota bacterium]QCI27848.1 tRNA (guanosine(46)-N7)-methyltransferase TrmB [Caminibacter pacificus]ROR39975.1 tRNA (guanine-N7-)-methyltransferase [Caminibacter pacificus]
MPHIVIDKIKNIDYPVKSGDVEFLFKAENLIGVKTPNAKFLIKVLPKEKGYLVKYDKITRPLISDIKKAYEEFVKLNEANILFENIKGIKEKLPNKNLLDITSDLSDIDIVEVGFGSGRHLIHLAKENPDKIILGIEIHKPSIEQVLKRIEHEKIENIRVLNHDARIILSKIQSNRLSAIYVHFPVPWDKKPHRRVMNKDFINESIRTLKKDGFLHLRTDSPKYFNYSLNLFLDYDEIDIRIKKNRPYVVSSKYEDRWKKMNKDIFDIYMYNFTISEPLVENFDFSFEKRLENLDFKPKIYNNFVIHIEKVFKIDETKELIRATIGNFNRPEHIYILNKDKPEYFKMPAPIKENYEAHLELKRLFNGDNSRCE